MDFLFVDLDYVEDLYTEPSRKRWVDCALQRRPAKVIMLAITIIFMMLIMVVLNAFNYSGVYQVGLLFIFIVFGSTFGILLTSSIANYQWRDFKQRIVSMSPTITDLAMFDNYDTQPANKQHELKKLWLETATSIRNIDVTNRYITAVNTRR
jgi:hypothetical protein